MSVSRGQLVAQPIGASTPNEAAIKPAQMIVAAHSRNAGECREFLAMLGLLPGAVEVDMGANIELEDPRPYALGKEAGA